MPHGQCLSSLRASVVPSVVTGWCHVSTVCPRPSGGPWEGWCAWWLISLPWGAVGTGLGPRSSSDPDPQTCAEGEEGVLCPQSPERLSWRLPCPGQAAAGLVGLSLWLCSLCGLVCPAVAGDPCPHPAPLRALYFLVQSDPHLATTAFSTGTLFPSQKRQTPVEKGSRGLRAALCVGRGQPGLGRWRERLCWASHLRQPRCGSGSRDWHRVWFE